MVEGGHGTRVEVHARGGNSTGKGRRACVTGPWGPRVAGAVCTERLGEVWRVTGGEEGYGVPMA